MLDELETLYRSRLPEFRRVAAGIAGDRELGCDAVQEAFASAVRKRRTFRGSGTLEAWVWRIVVNAARDARRRRPAPACVTCGVDDDPPDPRLERALAAEAAALPHRARECFLHRVAAELPVARDAGRDAAELRQPGAVERLELGEHP